MFIHKYINTVSKKIRGLSIISQLKEDIKSTIEHPIDHLGYQLCRMVGLTSALYGGILWLYFLFAGGYGGAIDNIKSGDYQALIQLHGELASRYYSSILFTIMTVLLCVALIAVVIKGLHYRRKVVRCILLTLLIFCMIAMSCAVLFPYCIIYLAQNEHVYNYIEEIGMTQIEEIWMNITIAIIGCTLITLCIICCGKEVRDDGHLWLIVCLITTAGVPLLISILENILRLIALAIMFALIAVVLRLFTDGFSDAPSSAPVKSSSSPSISMIPSKPRQSSQEPKITEYVDRGFLGCKVFRVHGTLHDYVEYDNGVGTREICSLDDFRKGKFHIIDKATKKAIQEHEIPWRK